MHIEPVLLEGTRARLIPLTEEHVGPLYEAARDKSIWQHYPTRRRDWKDIEQIVTEALLAQAQGRELPFTIIDKRTGLVVGSTRFMDISRQHRGMEIGWTWLQPYLWGTGFNEECKVVLLSHAFEKLKAIRVYLKTDENNLRSRKAIQKIGATFEGILRNHMIRDDGSYRHSAVYSIIEEEWPAVKEKLQTTLAKFSA